MTQVTRLGGVIPILNKGAIGYDPGEVADSEDTPDPVDVAADGTGAVAEVPFIVGGSVALVQSKVASSANVTLLVSATFDTPPTQGNLLTIAIELRDELASTFNTPAGWTQVDAVSSGTSTNDSCAMFYRVAGASEPSTVDVTVDLANAKRMVIAEWSGVQVLDASTSLANQAGATTHSIGPIAPTAGVAALILALFVKNVGDGNPHAFSPGSGYTTLDEGMANVNIHPRYEVEYKLVGTTSGSYTPDATQSDSDKWAAIVAVFEPAPGDVLWNLAPETIDVNDSTYDAVAAATSDDSIWRIQLANAAKISHVVVKIGAAGAGAQSSDLYGATLPDFSDEVLLATRAWTATGSYTSDTIDLLPPGTTAYQYYRLTGPDDVRIYTVNMFAPVTVTTADLSGYQQTSEKDQPNGYPSLDSGRLVPVAELPNVEDLNSAETDTTLVLAPDGAGGVEFRAETGGSGLPWFNVMDPAYGAVNDGSTNDKAAINAAIAALNSAGSGVLYFPAGDGYYTDGAFTTITASGTVLGDGMGIYADETGPGPAGLSSVITTDSATAVLFTVNGLAMQFRQISIINTNATPSAGGAVFADNASEHRQRCNFDSVFISDFYDCIDEKVNGAFTMVNVSIANPRHYGVRVRNTVQPDGGGFTMIGCAIVGEAQAATAGVRIETSGGNKIIGTNIVNVGTYCVQLVAGADSSILIIDSSSFEQYTGDGVHLDGNGHSYGLVSIKNSEFGQYSNGSGHGIYTTGIYGVTIEGNVFRFDTGTPTAISLNNGSGGYVGPQVTDGANTLIATSSYTGFRDGTGSIAAQVAITGTPSSGQVPVASSGTAAAWGAATPGGAAGGDLSGTYPNPWVVDDSHNHTAATLPVSVGTASDHEHVMGVLFSGDASTTVFTLPVSPVDANSVQAFVAGVLTDVTLSGTLRDTATFGSAPGAATNNVRFDIVAATL